MKIKLLICLLIALLGVPLWAAPPRGGSGTSTMPAQIDNDTYIDVNRILMFVTNHGNFGRDLAGVFGNDYGTYYPFSATQYIEDGSNNKSPYYAGGLWVGGVDSATGDTLLALSEYASEYVGGPMLNGTFQTDRPEYRVYKLYRDSMATNPNQDYLDWPVDQGAPVDSLGLPELIGDQMCWAVFNDADPTGHQGNVDAGETGPLGIEVRQTVFGFDRQASLGDMVFIKHQIFNKGNKTLNDCYISLWSDPDLGQSGDDLVGCDTLLDLGFCYNENETDQKYSPTPPPCLGIDFFQGPLVEGDASDTALMWDTIWPGYKNMGLYSFNKYINGTDPDAYDQTYMFMEGLDGKNEGAPYVYAGDTLLFVQSGDPVAGTGDLDAAGADRRMMQTTGPITFHPGDSVEIIAALIVGQGSSRLNSISVMKRLDDFAQKLYDAGRKPGKKSFFPMEAPAKPVVTIANLDNLINLSWGDTSEVDQGDYQFEGYTVWQATDASGPWVELVTYDVVNEWDVSLIDTFPDAYAGVPLPLVMRKVINTGLDYNYTVDEDAVNGGPLRNLTTYFFKVTAFSYAFLETALDENGDEIYTYLSAGNDTIPAGERFLEDGDVLTIMPQAAVTGYTPNTTYGEVLAVTHAAGASDGVVTPEVVDPRALTGHTYRVTFGIDSVWDTLIEEEDHFTYDTLTDTCDVGWVFDTVGDTGYVEITFCVDTILDSTTYDTAIFMDENWFWNLEDTTLGVMLADSVFNVTGDDAYRVFDGVLLTVSGPDAGISRIVEVQNAAGPVSPWDNVVFSLNSTRDFYVTSDNGADLTRLNWRGLMGTDDWEFRFTDMDEGSQYYDWNTDVLQSDTAPFQIWNLGFVLPGTDNDPSDDVRINFSFLDDDVSGEWSWGDRLYPWEVQYVEPIPAAPPYSFPADFQLGRIIFVDYSQALSAPAPGTIVRFISAKPITAEDVYIYTTAAPSYAENEGKLDAIKAVPNPYYLYGPYDPAVGNSQIYFSHLPEECTITIYNLAGDYINRVEKDDPSTSVAYWNVRTENNLPVASGVYIYVVDAPGFGQKIGKMAVFTESEVLDIY